MSDHKALIKAAIFTPTAKGWGLPLMFWGDPGVAKTDLIEDVCRSHNMYLKVLSPAEHGEGAFGVVPVPYERKGAGGKARGLIGYPEPDWLLELEEYDGRGVVFVDEMPHAPPGIRPALLGLIQSRRIGGAQLGTLCRVLAAGNPPGAGAGGHELLSSQANRVGHVNWIAPNVGAWCDWLSSLSGAPIEHKRSEFDAATEEARVLSEWGPIFTKKRAVIMSFLKAIPSHLHRMPDEDAPVLSKAWPSRRSWYFATLAATTALAHKLDAGDAEVLMSSFVGEGVIKELIAFEAKLELPDPARLLDGKVSFKHDAKRPDITKTIMDSMAMTVADPRCEHRKPRLAAFWGYCEELVDAQIPDFAVNAARMVVKSPPLPDGTKTLEGKAAQKALSSLMPVMQAAGVL